MRMKKGYYLVSYRAKGLFGHTKHILEDPTSPKEFLKHCLDKTAGERGFDPDKAVVIAVSKLA